MVFKYIRSMYAIYRWGYIVCIYRMYSNRSIARHCAMVKTESKSGRSVRIYQRTWYRVCVCMCVCVGVCTFLTHSCPLLCLFSSARAATWLNSQWRRSRKAEVQPSNSVASVHCNSVCARECVWVSVFRAVCWFEPAKQKWHSRGRGERQGKEEKKDSSWHKNWTNWKWFVWPTLTHTHTHIQAIVYSIHRLCEREWQAEGGRHGGDLHTLLANQINRLHWRLND